MRSLLAPFLAVLLCGPVVTGCTIWDELNASAELMDSMEKDSSKKKKADEEAAAQAGNGQTAPRADPLLASKKWWKDAQTLSSKPIDQSIVSCRLQGGRTQFMSRPQCMASNGKPSSAAR